MLTKKQIPTKTSQFIRCGSLILLSSSLLFPFSAKAANSLNQREVKQEASLSRSTEQLSEVLIAQSPSQIVREIQESYGRIKVFALDLAKSYSPSSLEWRDADVEFVESQGVLKITMYGRAPALIGRRAVRLTLSFKADERLNFRYENDAHLYVSRCGRGRPVCRRKRRRAYRNIEAALNKNRGTLEAQITNEARRLLSN